MTRHKERTLENLYNVTPSLPQPEITPVLSGSCRMQGPVDEADYDLQPDMVSQSDKDFTSFSDKSQKVNVRAKSGTCNVCSSPCSSCLHNYQVLMVTKADKFSGETCTGSAVFDQGIRFDIGQNSETSNVVCINSTSDSFSENVVGKATLRMSDASEDTVMLSHYDGVKVLEGHDDNLSCISASNEAEVLTNGVRNGDGTNLPCSSTCSPVEKSEYTIGYQTSSQHMDKCDIEDGMILTSRQNKIFGEFSDKMPSSSSPTCLSSQNLSLMEIPLKSTYDSSELVKVENTLLQASNGKSLSDDPNLMDLEENLHPLPQGTQLECSRDQLNLMSLKEVVSDVICDNPPGGTLNSMKKNEDMVEVQPSNVSDDSDMEEQDVKVCDICGDAGREDLLAVCSRCSDGAEHTYCMEEMVTKVPEGNWLCEECNVEEQMSSQRQDKIGRIDGNEKNNSCGQASSENKISFDVEGNRTQGCSNMKTCGKRPRDDNEVSSMTKKPAIESIMGSPRNSNSSKTAALSRESSFKNLDKGRLQPINHSSSATLPVNDTLESACASPDSRIQTSRGTLSKSHSLNFPNSNAKVKLVDQVALQRSVRVPASIHLKDGAVKSMGKSMSFKSTNSGRSESKVKMISPRLTHVQDIKHRKERSSFERKSSFKSERPSISSTMAKSAISTSNSEKKLGSLGESSLTKRHETKAAQTENKSTGLMKSLSLVARRSSDSHFSSGEFKTPSSYVHSTTGVSSANVVGNFEQKLNQIVSEEDSSSCAGVSERPPCNTNEGLHDGFLQPREATNSGELMREHSGNRLWEGNTNGGRAILCKKCKEFGHVAQSCMADDAGFPAVSPTVKFSRDENDSVKVAIEAAMRRKPGVHRKHRAWDQSDHSSVSSMKSEIDCRDQLSSSGGKRNVSSAAEIIERHTEPGGLTENSVKQETCDTSKQSMLLPVEALCSGGEESVPVVPLDGKFSLRGTSTSAAVPICLKSSAIPEHEYIWQGSFEVFRSGKILDLREGIQAHLSTCASPKVIEAVNKFNHRIILNEVPRLSTWPVQFQEFGVREDNIALFFFARDCESYEKSYKILLESMMKNDLALKANLNGVELLIFPSNQLPENSQRWNMLFFLWGVFRGKKEYCSQRLPESSKQFCTPPDIPPAIMSLPENKCSLGPITKDLSACDDVAPSPEVSPSGKLWSKLSSKVVNGDFGTKVLSVDQLDDRLDSISLSTERSTSAKLCHEMSGPCLEGVIDSIFTPEAESQAFLQTTGSANGSTREQILMQLDAASNRQLPSHYFDISPAGTNVMASGDSTGEGIRLDKMNGTKDQVKFRLNSDKEASLEENLGKRDLDTKESNSWLLKHSEHLHDDSKYVEPKTIYSGTSEAVLRNGSADVVLAKVSIDRQKNTDLGGLDTCDVQTSSSIDGFASLINSVDYGFSVQENGYGEGFNESVIPERYFFPVDPHSMNGLGFVNKSTPWKIHPEVEDSVHDKVPDLELALGAERKPSPKGIPPFLVGKVEKKIKEEHHLLKAANKADDDASASLSLSLSFSS